MLNNGTAKIKLGPSKKTRITIMLVVLFLALAVAGWYANGITENSDNQTSCIVEITDPDASRPDVVGYEPPKVCIEFERAVTADEQKVGLSKYSSYDDTRGMIFEYDTPGDACMWMKDMKFPIDMVWLNSSKQIVKIEVNVAPNTYPDKFCSKDPAKYVIELNRFVSEYAGLEVGQHISL